MYTDEDGDVTSFSPNELLKDGYPDKKPIAVAIVLGGVVEVFARNADVRIVDIDNIKAGDDKVQLPSGIGFEKLVKEANVEEYVDFVNENNGD